MDFTVWVSEVEPSSNYQKVGGSIPNCSQLVKVSFSKIVNDKVLSNPANSQTNKQAADADFGTMVEMIAFYQSASVWTARVFWAWSVTHFNV